MNTDMTTWLDRLFNIVSLNREVSQDYKAVKITFITEEADISITLDKDKTEHRSE